LHFVRENINLEDDIELFTHRTYQKSRKRQVVKGIRLIVPVSTHFDIAN